MNSRHFCIQHISFLKCKELLCCSCRFASTSTTLSPSCSCIFNCRICQIVAGRRAKQLRHAAAIQSDPHAIITSAGTSVNRLVCWSVSRLVGRSVSWNGQLDMVTHSATPLVGQSVRLNCYLLDIITKVVLHVLE